jgi:hypothetical protein
LGELKTIQHVQGCFLALLFLAGQESSCPHLLVLTNEADIADTTAIREEVVRQNLNPFQ